MDFISDWIEVEGNNIFFVDLRFKNLVYSVSVYFLCHFPTIFYFMENMVTSSVEEER